METAATHAYAPPVDQLLRLGECLTDHWPHYGLMGFGPEHVPELIRLSLDPELDYETVEGWGPIHAWRVLGMLRAASATEPLISIFDDWEDLDWPAQELPHVFGMIGRRAILPLTRAASDASRTISARIEAANGLGEIAALWPQHRDECVAVLTRLLDDPDEDEEFSGFLVCDLLDLNAVEAAPVIERAYAEDRVDISIPGDWEDAQIQLGIIPARITPAPAFNLFGGLPIRIVPPRPEPPRHVGARLASKSAARTAGKRKRDKAARKKNKRRR